MTITSAEGHGLPRPRRDTAPSMTRSGGFATGQDRSVTPDALFDIVDRLTGDNHYNSPQRDMARDIMRGMATRPDLTKEQVTRLAQQHDWGITARLMKNGKYRNRRAVREAFAPEVVLSLLDEPETFAETIIAHIDGVCRGSRGPDAQRFIDMARTALGPDLLDRTLIKMMNDGGYSAREAADSPLLTSAGWDAALARISATEGKQRDTLLAQVGTILMRRSDSTPERILALLDLSVGSDYDRWMISAFVRSEGGPAEVWSRIVLHKDRYIAEDALSSDSCPDEARWAAARKHRPHGLNKARGPIPTDVARVVLADLARGRAWGKPLSAEFAGTVRRHLLRLTDDEGIWADLFAEFIADPSAHQDREYRGEGDANGVSLFYYAATRNMFGDSGGKADKVLSFLARQDNVKARAFVVSRLIHPADLLAAAQDPEPTIRQIVAGHPLLPDDARLLLSRDEDLYVRLAVAERTDNWRDMVIDLSADEEVAVRLAIAEQVLPEDHLINVLAKDKDVAVRLAVAGKPLPTDLLVEMSQDVDGDVRLAVVEQDLPLHVLQRLANDPDPRVAEQVAVKFLAALQTDISDKEDDQ